MVAVRTLSVGLPIRFYLDFACLRKPSMGEKDVQVTIVFIPCSVVATSAVELWRFATRRGREILSRRNECKTAVLAAGIRWSDEGGRSVGREGRGRWAGQLRRHGRAQSVFRGAE